MGRSLAFSCSSTGKIWRKEPLVRLDLSRHIEWENHTKAIQKLNNPGSSGLGTYI